MQLVCVGVPSVDDGRDQERFILEPTRSPAKMVAHLRRSGKIGKDEWVKSIVTARYPSAMKVFLEKVEGGADLGFQAFLRAKSVMDYQQFKQGMLDAAG